MIEGSPDGMFTAGAPRFHQYRSFCLPICGRPYLRIRFLYMGSIDLRTQRHAICNAFKTFAKGNIYNLLGRRGLRSQADIRA